MTDELGAPQDRSPMGSPGIINNYYGTNIGHAVNADFGVNNGAINNNITSHDSPAVPLLGTQANGLSAILNPILDASHTRNRKTSPPDSVCFPGTRQHVLQDIRLWLDSSILHGKIPHIMWIYGYAGCGKSAVAQAVAQEFAGCHRLAASFFFFRNSGDRSKIARFANTIASQVADAIPATAPIIEAAVNANPALLSVTATSLSAQFERLVYKPINAVKWDNLASPFRKGPFLVVLDGLDECDDRDEVAAFIEHMIAYFNKKLRIPLRILITSRVEQHIHQRLHSSEQVQLLDLVNHSSDADIAIALDVSIAAAKRGRVLACEGTWPSMEDKKKLVEHIGGSYIFMTTIVKFIFDPNANDGLTPITRLPLALDINPGFDGLYSTILEQALHFPYFRDIINTITLVKKPLSIAQIADVLDIKSVDVVNVLVNLHAIMQIPGDDHTPITLCHTSLRDFLSSDSRSGHFYAHPDHHERLALRCIDLAKSPASNDTVASAYARAHVWEHSRAFLYGTSDEGRRNLHLTAILKQVHLFQQDFIGDIRDDILDGFYEQQLSGCQGGPHVLAVISTIALTVKPLSISQIANCLAIRPVDVANALANLHAVMQIPEDNRTPVKVWHKSLCDFLRSESRSRSFYASPQHHRQLACWYITMYSPSYSSPGSPALDPEERCRLAVGQFKAFLKSSGRDLPPLETKSDITLAHLQEAFPTQYPAVASVYFLIDQAFMDMLQGEKRFNTLLKLIHTCSSATHPIETPIVRLITKTLEAIMRQAKPGSFREGLLGHLKQSHPHLFDRSRHLDIVLRGLTLFIGRRASDGTVLLVSNGDGGSEFATEYMFCCWTRHLALAIRAGPKHAVFDPVGPTALPVEQEDTAIKYDIAWSRYKRLYMRAAANLKLALDTVRDKVGPQALALGSACDWSNKEFVLQKPSAHPITVYDVLNGVRLLLLCYEGSCHHSKTSLYGPSTCTHISRWQLDLSSRSARDQYLAYGLSALGTGNL